jgi:OOP family OmpA-OmpF porin
MRKNLTRALCTAVALSLASFGAAGCTVKASGKIGGGEAKPPPPPPPAPAPAPAPAPKKKRSKFGGIKFKVDKSGKVQLPGPVLFETGTAKLKAESDAVLSVVDKYLKAKKEITKLRIEGHTDTDGDDKANQGLSERRAMSVAAWLIAKGNECGRLVPVGFGETKLLAMPEKTPDDKAKNRRVNFMNAEVNGKPIGGLPVDGGGKLAGDPCTAPAKAK